MYAEQSVRSMQLWSTRAMPWETIIGVNFRLKQQMGFRIPIAVAMDLPHFRERGPVITASEYLCLHGQGPEVGSTDGVWPQELYHSQVNVFERDQTKTSSLFVIENHGM